MARLFIEDFVEIHEFVGDHRPGGQLRHAGTLASFFDSPSVTSLPASSADCV